MLTNIIVLFAVVALDGLAKVERGSVVVAKSLGNRWSIRTPIRLWKDFHWVSPLVPILVYATLPLSAKGASTLPHVDGVEDASSWTSVVLLHWLSLVEWTLLVLVLPVATDLRGSYGAGLAFLGIVLVAWQTRIALSVLCAHAKDPLPEAKSWTFLWPFRAVRAAEYYLAGRLRDVDAVPFIWDRVDRTQLRRMLRSSAYDFHSTPESTGQDRDWRNIFVRNLSAAQLAELLQPERPSDNACPRCCAVYREEIAFCADCGVALSGAEFRRFGGNTAE